MKKVVITVCLAISLIIAILSFSHAYNNIDKTIVYSNNNSSLDSNEKLYQNTITAFLSPYIDKAIKDYYGQYFSHDPWYDKILSIKGAENESNYVVKIETQPYYGPHRWVGVDHITIRITVNGDVKVEKFEHVKTIDIPPVPTHP